MTREEAIEKVRQMSLPKETMEILEALAPELAESEDERIREALIGHFRTLSYDLSVNGFSKEDFVAWLEKQKEPENVSASTMIPSCWAGKQKEQSITSNNLDEEIHRFFDDCIDVHEAKLYGSVSERVIPVDCYELTARHFAKWGEKQKEQNLIMANSPQLKLPIQGKGVYKICPHCKERMIRDDSKVYTSMPPQYGYKCPKCGTMEFDTVIYDSPKIEEQKPTLEQTLEAYKISDERATAKMEGRIEGRQDVINNPEEYGLQKPAEWSEEDDQLIGFIFDLLNDLVWRKDWAMSKEECLKRLNSLRPQQKEENNEWNKKPCLTCDEYERGKKDGYREGFDEGYKKANEAMSFHYDNFHNSTPCYAPGGVCTNPHFDCINCPKKTTGGSFTVTTKSDEK